MKRRPKRSDSTPARTPVKAIGTNRSANAMLTTAGDLVRSKTSQPIRATLPVYEIQEKKKETRRLQSAREFPPAAPLADVLENSVIPPRQCPRQRRGHASPTRSPGRDDVWRAISGPRVCPQLSGGPRPVRAEVSASGSGRSLPPSRASTASHP